MTPAEYARARRLLMRRDPILRHIIAEHGPCGLPADRSTDAFSAILEAIVSQQLSSKAAATIFARFRSLFPPHRHPAPEDILGMPDATLRAVGLSRQKIGYMRDLSEKVRDGSLALDQLAAMTDDEVIEAMTRVKGIGRWSAEMILIFRLQRRDVLPVGDLGIVKAIQNAYGLRKPPKPERILKIGERWRPYRSVASWYLWASLDNAPRPARNGQARHTPPRRAKSRKDS
jgi:3-methyladenine DNA glycosylase/8-oxoguanine DNA glycosylase